MQLSTESEAVKISFNKREDDFISTLRERVNLYFKERQLSPRANRWMHLKSLFLQSLVVLNYFALLFAPLGFWGALGLFATTGFLISVSTMNIAHDALHGAYVSRSWGNRALGLLMDVFGASSFYWRREHVVEHHTFTNIAEHDADLDVPVLLRLCPEAPYRRYHRFQHWYAPFLYCLNIIHWIYVSDMKRIYKILKNRRQGPGMPSQREVCLLILFKIVHLFLFVAVPILVLPLAWWQVLIGYFASLAIAGLTLTTIFQLAHIVEEVSFPVPDEGGKMEHSFFKHQLSTTSNFAMKSRLVHFLFGGLNFQIEHHLFPHICHIHLPKIAPIVEATTREFGMPYHSKPSFAAAVMSHLKILKKLGSAA